MLGQVSTPSIAADDADAIDAACSALEDSWRAGRVPDLALFFQGCGEERRAAWLRELIEVDRWWRRQRGLPHGGDFYRSQFPSDTAAIDEALRTHPTESSEATPESSPRQGMSTFLPSRFHDDTDGPARASAADSLAAGSRVGSYEILGEIARGGMGVVYKARQSSVNRVVALKMTLAGQFAGNEERRRFLAEAEAAGRLDHPNIVPIHDAGEHEGRLYFSMGFVDGASLAARIQGEPAQPRQAAEWILAAAEAVAYAHSRGVIHRDLKPANILVSSEGQVRITDFGLARIEQSSQRLTGTGQLLGTPSYMSPEQAAGRHDLVGPLTDVYALGATLYCLLTGRPPFLASSPLGTLQQVLNQPIVPPRQLNPDIPPALEELCLSCLEKEPPRRCPSASELSRRLRDYLTSPESQAVSPPAAQPKTVLSLRPAVRIAAIGIAAAALVAAVWGGASAMKNRPANISLNRPSESIAGSNATIAGVKRDNVANERAPASNAAGIPSDTEASRTDAAIGPPLRVKSFRVTHYRSKGELSERAGEIGVESNETQENDSVRVSISLSGPAYCYLIAFNPDGSTQLCWPEKDSNPPHPTNAIEYPPRSTSAFYLTDGAGQQVFAVVACRKPLPSFADWQRARPELRWNGATAMPPLLFDSADDGIKERLRGTVGVLKGAAAFQELCLTLKDSTPADVVSALTFPVKPQER